MYYIDIHTHKPNFDKDVYSVVNLRLGSNNKKDAFLLSSSLTPVFSLGLHPYDINEQSDINLLNEIKNEEHFVAIGECGFDKNIEIPYFIQEEIFVKQVEISELLHKPVIIHCVGYYNELMGIKAELNPSEKWIIHGFTGHQQLAKQLINNGFKLSFGKALFDDKSKAFDSFKMIPKNSFFLETDESEKTIEEIYFQASKIKNISIEHLKTLIYNNFIDTFKQKYGME